jgi:hypothetical protein
MEGATMTVSQNGCQYLLAHHDESVGEIHGVGFITTREVKGDLVSP